MRTVKEVSKLTGVSVRTLHYYDAIGLLEPTKVTDAGYRMYDDTALSRLQNILLFRELQFQQFDLLRHCFFLIKIRTIKNFFNFL